MMSTASDENLSEVCRLVRERAGFLPESLGTQGIAHAVRRRMSASGADTLPDYLHRLLLDGAEFQELLEDLVVPETWFFRDVLAFRCLARYLDAWRSPVSGVVRVLSVACSTGEEVYSLAMALREAGLESSRFFILGTDLSRRSLEQARNGSFSPRSFRELGETVGALRDRWCEPVGESWRVRDELRAGVEFKWGNLAQREFLASESPFHVVFCRNVLIYFHAEARRVAVRHLHRLLSPDGLLSSAPAEARIFSEAGFMSLGSECPFAFRRQDEFAETPPAAEVARWRQVKSLPVSGGHAVSLLPAPRRADLAMRSPELPGRGDTDEGALLSAANATPEELSGEALLHAARQAADNGRLEEADALCGQVLSRDFASAEAHYLRGVVRQAQGIFSEAQRSLEKALYLDPRHYEALVHMMLLAERGGDRLAAANYRRRAQQVAPREAE